MPLKCCITAYKMYFLEATFSIVIELEFLQTFVVVKLSCSCILFQTILVNCKTSKREIKMPDLTFDCNVNIIMMSLTKVEFVDVLIIKYKTLGFYTPTDVSFDTKDIQAFGVALSFTRIHSIQSQNSLNQFEILLNMHYFNLD